MQVVFLIGCLVIALLSLSPTVSAQDTGPSAQDDEAAALLEEIRVVGDRSFFAIRFQIRDAEESLYAMFNELNSSDEFDIHCETIRITSTNIPRRICEPYFMVRARQANAIMSLAGIREALNFSDPENPAGAGIAASAWENGITTIEDERELKEGQAHQFEALNEEMLRIAIENPEYLEALLQVESLKAEFSEMRSLKFGD